MTSASRPSKAQLTAQKHATVLVKALLRRIARLERDKRAKARGG